MIMSSISGEIKSSVTISSIQVYTPLHTGNRQDIYSIKLRGYCFLKRVCQLHILSEGHTGTLNSELKDS